MLGNDVVDFHIDEQKYNNPRFINRILTRQEQHHLKQSTNPNRFLWSLWAAKEAAYKALQRNNTELIFSPVTLTVSETTLQQLLLHDIHETLYGQVQYQEHHINLKFEWPKATVVHCLALTHSQVSKWYSIKSKARYVNNLTSYQQQSQAVRELAQELLQQHHINAKISRPIITMNGYQKSGPPILTDNTSGQVLPHIISLSHDNQYLAAAVYLKQT
ncbi:4'-phosphopantetheinyl transferase superfamily protein [Marinicella gelatinilytica]|uniref:4'-phosphopantetheinyl transferase superfamily protein n=1 Tax=Marinicella gelatinilytica TaxID=2996017 RepID=UPI002260EC83|nr:4'-phosphopantetheinyl transferase superfamily protein [Marinicella gelatinilytica]MCX7544027.1 4'-phosphopantetheinyl transferase superfamily protein [Marinicella gelatinilytica]